MEITQITIKIHDLRAINYTLLKYNNLKRERPEVEDRVSSKVVLKRRPRNQYLGPETNPALSKEYLYNRLMATCQFSPENVDHIGW